MFDDFLKQKRFRWAFVQYFRENSNENSNGNLISKCKPNIMFCFRGFRCVYWSENPFTICAVWHRKHSNFILFHFIGINCHHTRILINVLHSKMIRDQSGFIPSYFSIVENDKTRPPTVYHRNWCSRENIKCSLFFIVMRFFTAFTILFWWYWLNPVLNLTSYYHDGMNSGIELAQKIVSFLSPKIMSELTGKSNALASE